MDKPPTQLQVKEAGHKDATLGRINVQQRSSTGTEGHRSFALLLLL